MLQFHANANVHANVDASVNCKVNLVSTYVVCERLSVMHEPAGVVENLVQILQNTPYSVIQNTPPAKIEI